MQDDDHFLTVCRYVGRNALRANLVKRAEDWRWSSLYRWSSGTAAEKELLSALALRRNAGWLEHVNSTQLVGRTKRSAVPATWFEFHSEKKCIAPTRRIAYCRSGVAFAT